MTPFKNKNDQKRIDRIIKSKSILYYSPVSKEIKLLGKNNFTKEKRCDVCIRYLSRSDCKYKEEPFESLEHFKRHILEIENKYRRELIWIEIKEIPVNVIRGREIGILKNLEKCEYLKIRYPGRDPINVKKENLISHFRKNGCYCKNNFSEKGTVKFRGREDIFSHLKSLEIRTGKEMLFDGKHLNRLKQNLTPNFLRIRKIVNQLKNNSQQKAYESTTNINSIKQAEKKQKRNKTSTNPKRQFQNDQQCSTIGNPVAVKINNNPIDKNLNMVSTSEQSSSGIIRERKSIWNFKIPKISNNLNQPNENSIEIGSTSYKSQTISNLPAKKISFTDAATPSFKREFESKNIKAPISKGRRSFVYSTDEVNHQVGDSSNIKFIKKDTSWQSDYKNNRKKDLNF